MPEPERPPLSRKIYIATSKDVQAKETAFGGLGNVFDINATDPEGAEFIVVDCEDTVRPATWLQCRPEMVFLKPCRPAFVLVALKGQPDEKFLETLENTYEGDLSVFDIVRSYDDLLRRLRWVESVVPFYNRKNSPTPAFHEFALALMKSQMVASPFTVQG